MAKRTSSASRRQTTHARAAHGVSGLVLGRLLRARLVGSRFLAALLTVALLAPAAHAARMSYGEIEVACDFQPTGNPSHGYTEFRVAVANKGSERPRQVRLEFPGATFAGRGSGGLRGISRTVEVRPGEVVTVSLLQPAMPEVVGSGLTVYIDGRKQDDQLSLSPVSGHGGSIMYGRRGWARPAAPAGAMDYLVLTSQRVGENFIKVPGVHGAGMGAGPVAGGAMHAAPGGPGMPPPPAPAGPPAIFGGVGIAGPVIQAIQGQFLRADLPVSGWSDRWLAYSRYDGVLLTREDLDELERGAADSKAILLALRQYVEAGGTLVVLGPGEVKVSPSWARDTTTIDRLKVHRAGFGLCVVAPDRDSASWSGERWQALQAAISSTGAPWRAQRSLLDLNNFFPVVDDLGLPVGGLFALMIVFGLAIGPANLMVLSRKKKRIWLLWTVPALSAFFCVLVMGYMIVAEGWRGHARVAGITLLDEAERRATTLGKAAFYSPMTPGDGLRFSEDTEVQIQGGEHPAYSGYTYLDWTGEQHLARGWVTARVPAHFLVRKSKQQLERLTLRKDGDGALTAVNALGADISRLTLADEKGDLYEAGAIAAGASAKLTKAGERVRSGSPGEARRRLYSGTDWGTAIEATAKAHKELLGPGMYVAVLEESPFLEQPLRGAKVRQSPSVVVGIMAEAR